MWVCAFVFWGGCGVFVLQKYFRFFVLTIFYAWLLRNVGRSTRKQKGHIYRLLVSFTTILFGTRISSQISIEVFLLTSQIVLQL